MSRFPAMLTDDAIRAELDAAGLEPRRPDQRMTSMGAGSDDLESGRAYLAATVTGGWAVPTWPSELGGRDAADCRLHLGDSTGQ